MSLKKFLTKHSVELSKVATVLGAIVSGLPMDRQDKRNLGSSVRDIFDAAANIASSAAKMKDVDIKLDKAAIKKTLEEILPDMIAGIIEKKLRDAQKPAKVETPTT